MPTNCRDYYFCSRHPEIKWAQREDKVFLTVVLADTKDAKVNLAPEGVFTFSAKAGQHEYDLKLELFDKVNVEVSNDFTIIPFLCVLLDINLDFNVSYVNIVIIIVLIMVVKKLVIGYVMGG